MIDSTIYTVTYTYPSRLGARLDCSMTSEAVVEGSENAERLRDMLREAGVREIHIETFRAPEFRVTLDAVRHALNEYPVRVEEVQP
jgi:hypothetical protein